MGYRFCAAANANYSRDTYLSIPVGGSRVSVNSGFLGELVGGASSSWAEALAPAFTSWLYWHLPGLKPRPTTVRRAGHPTRRLDDGPLVARLRRVSLAPET